MRREELAPADAGVNIFLSGTPGGDYNRNLHAMKCFTEAGASRPGRDRCCWCPCCAAKRCVARLAGPRCDLIVLVVVAGPSWPCFHGLEDRATSSRQALKIYRLAGLAYHIVLLGVFGCLVNSERDGSGSCGQSLGEGNLAVLVGCTRRAGAMIDAEMPQNC